MLKIKFFVISLLISLVALAQSKVEVLYFKANLSCCKARVCSLIENDIRTIVENEFKDKNVEFKTIRIADEANKPLVEKYNATSQTLIIVAHNKKKEKFEDVSYIVKNYTQNNDKETLKKELVSKISKYVK